MYTRNCPKCNKEINHKHKKSYQESVRKNKICVSCANQGDNWIDLNDLRYDCPICGITRNYGGKRNYLNAKNNSLPCQSCNGKKTTDRLSGRKLSESHRAKTIEHLNNPQLREKQKEAARLYHIDNPGNDVLSKLKRKYGDNLSDFYKEKGKNSIGKFAGENNPMYGKPSPNGSGNGWSGWYLNTFFRSLIELSYMVEFLSATGCIWETAETSKFKIEYIDWEGKTRNYFPDYFVNNKYLVEIKPEKLWSTPKIKAKKEAAEKWCLERGYEYVLISPEKLPLEKIIELYKNKEIKFTDRYEKKFLEKYLNEK